MSSSNVAAVTRVFRRMSRRRSKRSATWLKYALELLLPGEDLGPLPLLLELVGEAERVLEARHVAARAGVAVPVPRAADTAARFEDDRGEPELAEVVQGVEAGHPGADDDHVDIDR